MKISIDDCRKKFLESKDSNELPIVDSHHHFWNPKRNYHPWLCDKDLIDFRYGDYSSIRTAYLPEDYIKDFAAHKFLASVYIETEWDPKDAIGEVKWIDNLAQSSAFPNAVIAQAWLHQDDITEQIYHLKKFDIVKGVRHKPLNQKYNEYNSKLSPLGSMKCKKWQRGFKLIAEHDLIFELQSSWWHLHELIPLLEENPKSTVILNHAGLPGSRDKNIIAKWQNSLKTVAEFPNVHIKISGLGIKNKNWTLEDNQQIIDLCIDIFTPNKCMFASNFPVDSLLIGLSQLFDNFKLSTNKYSAPDNLSMFCDNALSIYKIKTQ